MMRPFKPFLCPKVKFQWNDELDNAFESSKIEIVNAIKNGVEIFDPTRLTCLRSDWSQFVIGFSSRRNTANANLPCQDVANTAGG